MIEVKEVNRDWQKVEGQRRKGREEKGRETRKRVEGSKWWKRKVRLSDKKASEKNGRGQERKRRKEIKVEERVRGKKERERS